MGWVVKERRQSAREHELTGDFLQQGWSVGVGGPLARVNRQPNKLGSRVLGISYNVADDTLMRRCAERFFGNRIAVMAFTSYERHLHDLAPLAGLTNLQVISVNGEPIHDIKPLGRLTTLRWLNLGRTQISDFRPLAGLTNLEVLELDNTSIADLAPLVGMKKLHTIGLNDTHITDISQLKDLTELRGVFINNTRVRDATPLMGLKSLCYLMISGTQVPKEQIEDLQRALPNCKIWHESTQPAR
jgi:hypothetical protein